VLPGPRRAFFTCQPSCAPLFDQSIASAATSARNSSTPPFLKAPMAISIANSHQERKNRAEPHKPRRSTMWPRLGDCSRGCASVDTDRQLSCTESVNDLSGKPHPRGLGRQPFRGWPSASAAHARWDEIDLGDVAPVIELTKELIGAHLD
jgi:hypothetical protein